MRIRNCWRILTPSSIDGKDYFSQFLNVHKDNDVEEMEIQTAEPLIPDPTLLEVEIAIEKLKKY